VRASPVPDQKRYSTGGNMGISAERKDLAGIDGQRMSVWRKITVTPSLTNGEAWLFGGNYC